MALDASAKQIYEWHQACDDIDWETGIKKDPRLGKFLGGQGSRPISIGSCMIGNKFEHNTINIIYNCDKENVPPSSKLYNTF